jgi:lipoyl(octanoyl) transferase
MDLTPFGWINPCGYAGLAVTQTRDLGITASLSQLEQALSQRLAAALD